MSKLYAFWKHSSFPYVLGGPVTKMNDNGTVETKNFGKGYYFMPFKIVPLKTGQALQKALDRLEERHVAALRLFKAEWDKEAETLKNAINRGITKHD